MLSGLLTETRRKIEQLPRAYLTTLYFALGAYCRKTCGLWEGNTSLLEACGTPSASGAAAVILRAVWRRLHDKEEEDLTAARALLADLTDPEAAGESPRRQ